MKRILALCLVFMLSLSLVTPAAAGTEGPVTGRFGTSAVPTVNSIAVYTDAALTSPATSLTPQQTYWVKVSVTDNDGIGNLSKIYTHLWWDSDTTSGSAWSGYGAGNTPELDMGYTFINTAGTWSDAYTSGTTWAFALVSAPTVAQSSDTNITTFDFVYSVKIGKAARETTGVDRWQLPAIAEDAQAQTAQNAVLQGSLYGLWMNWYGEVIVPSSYTVDWGIVPSGMNFNSASAVEQITLAAGGVKYIANGEWLWQYKAAPTWTNGGSQTFTLSASPTTVNTFSLKVWPSGVLGDPITLGLVLPAGDTFVDGTAGGWTGQPRTAEIGNPTEPSLYLKLSPTVTNGGYFTGAITFGIRNY